MWISLKHLTAQRRLSLTVEDALTGDNSAKDEDREALPEDPCAWCESVVPNGPSAMTFLRPSMCRMYKDEDCRGLMGNSAGSRRAGGSGGTRFCSLSAPSCLDILPRRNGDRRVFTQELRGSLTMHNTSVLDLQRMRSVRLLEQHSWAVLWKGISCPLH